MHKVPSGCWPPSQISTSPGGPAEVPDPQGLAITGPALKATHTVAAWQRHLARFPTGQVIGRDDAVRVLQGGQEELSRSVPAAMGRYRGDPASDAERVPTLSTLHATPRTSWRLTC